MRRTCWFEDLVTLSPVMVERVARALLASAGAHLEPLKSLASASLAVLNAVGSRAAADDISRDVMLAKVVDKFLARDRTLRKGLDSSTASASFLMLAWSARASCASFSTADAFRPSPRAAVRVYGR
jgi:hypothetical protein